LCLIDVLHDRQGSEPQGPPSLRTHWGGSSVENRKRFADGYATMPGPYATAVPMLQAIPVTASDPPGILYPVISPTIDRTYGSLRDVPVDAALPRGTCRRLNVLTELR
jgi:hypothetical protein